MKRLIPLVLALVLVSGAFLMGCSSAAPTSAPTSAAPTAVSAPMTSAPPAPAAAAPAKTWKLRFGYEQSTTSYYHLYVWGPWGKSVEQATNGRVTVELYPSNTLMKSTDAVDSIMTGIADLAMVIAPYFPGKFTVTDVIALPFGSSTSSGASAIAWTMFEKTPEIQNAFADYKVISMWTTEPMYLHGTKKNYKTVDDFKGQNVRCSAGPSTDLINNLGGNAVFFSMADAYVNLQKGVVDAIVTPSEGAMGFRTYEVAPYLTHFPGPASLHMILMSKKVWNEMPVDVQQAIDSVSLGKLSKMAGEVNDQAAVDMTAKCKEAGVTLTEYTVPPDELNRWLEKAGTPMRQAWVKTMNEKGMANAQVILDEVIRLAQQYK